MLVLNERKSIVNLLTVLSFFLLWSMTGCSDNNSGTIFSPADLVNPLMGTDSEYKLSHGNTYPAIALG
jgi:hypothetical protein